jgi:hypothetical protein
LTFQAQYVPLSVQEKTRDRVKQLVELQKMRLSRTVTYDEVVNQAFDLWEAEYLKPHEVQRETV